MQFPSTHPSFFAPIFPGGRFLAHTSFYRIAQLRILVFFTEIYKEKIRQADALLIATPEYNYSVSGVLKNAFDWASRPPSQSVLMGKPTAIMGASPGQFGTVRAQLHLRQSLLYVNAQTLNKPEVFINHASQKFDADGNLLDEKARQLIRTLLDALVQTARR